jgi:hypothetical protein
MWSHDIVILQYLPLHIIKQGWRAHLTVKVKTESDYNTDPQYREYKHQID